MRKEFTIFIVFMVFVSLMVWLNMNGHARNSWQGKSPPNFEAQNLNGEIFKLSDVLGKKILLINFWATHCPPCRDEIPLLEKLQTRIQDPRFQIVSISEDSVGSIEALKVKIDAFREKIPFTFSVYSDPDGMIATLFGTFQIPETYLVDERGLVSRVFKGAFTASEGQALEVEIKQMLGRMESH